MRMRLGLLQDPAAIEAQIAREVKAAEAKRARTQAPTVKTEAQTIADAEAAVKEKDKVEKKVKQEHKLPRIRPLSESKAIETGANFISESFLFLVAGGLILFENRRSKKKSEKEHDRRDDEIDAIRAENTTIRAELDELKHSLQLPQLEGAKEPAWKTSPNEDESASKPPETTQSQGVPATAKSTQKSEDVKSSTGQSSVTSFIKSFIPSWPNR